MSEKITIQGLRTITATMAAISNKPMHVGGAYVWK